MQSQIQRQIQSEKETYEAKKCKAKFNLKRKHMKPKNIKPNLGLK